MLLKRGEVYDIDFGLMSNSVQGGRRPGIIVQNDVGNRFSPNVIAIPITSKNKPYMPTHVLISKGEAGLVKDSIALLENPLTVSKSSIHCKMGILSESTMSAIDIALDISLGRAKREAAAVMVNPIIQPLVLSMDSSKCSNPY